MNKTEEDIKKAAIGTGIDSLIVNAEKFDLSGADILRITDHKTNILPYEALEKVEDLNDVFNPYGSAVILYQTSEDHGHWVALIDRGNRRMEFYDPYGLYVDEELNINNEYHLRIHDGEITPHLSALIQKGGWIVDYNKVKLQKMLKDVNTCGRYCALRIRFKTTSMKKFNGLLTKNKHYPPDFWVSALTLLC